MLRMAVMLVTLLSAGSAMALPLEWGGELRIQMDVGGDEITTVEYSDGSESDLKAGTYMTFGLGGSLVPLRFENHALELAGFVGYGSWATGPENTDDRISFGRFPLELLAAWRLEFPDEEMALRLGAGVQYHLVSGISGSGRLDHVDVDVEDALGWFAEARGIYGIFALGFRYTAIEYEVPEFGTTLDGSSFGVSIGLNFPSVGSGRN